jgi:hypothetical protein
MTQILEGSPIRRFTTDKLVVPEESTLYHASKNLKDLLNRNRFDYRMSAHEGAFYFTDFPTIYTNCQVSVNQDLVMFLYGELSDQETVNLNAAGNGNLWIGGMNTGYDGRVFSNPDAFVKTESGRDALEIVVFPRSLTKLGKIKAYPQGSEKYLYKYLRHSST